MTPRSRPAPSAPQKVMTVYGTRPEAIKVAPVLEKLASDPRFESVPVVTGQHREMLDQVNEMFHIAPAHDLDILAPGQSLNQIVTRAIAGLDELIVDEQPDVVLVQGDTTTAMAAALAGFNRQVRVVHLEAGLRTGDISSPFPEEANRKLVSQVARLHLAPTRRARDNLIREAIDPSTIVVTGNTVIDSLLEAASWRTVPRHPELAAALSSGRPVILATMHRRENLGASMHEIAAALAALARRLPDHILVLPVHRNPAVREAVLPHLASVSNVVITEPLQYDEFTSVMAAARIVITDSGGVQEEAPSLGKPVLVLRDTTERPEAVESGTVRLVGTERDRIEFEAYRLLTDGSAYAAMANAVNPYGDGRASERAVAAIGAMLGIGAAPEEFGS
ncbi:UDP-N-acetylglucosamine 2-epimerase (non-hydrolyzing) [Agrococcus sp. SCSIO52902]|uniref:non-hydrolyzing UDP-N-acetylglucosamine 2-epimerase n=1 Tax=Agrococcus sp. SCSIO52902 TaxID=2933290 RepID=UPI001FF1F200|nr:UDP-N-acetylglucosamine 2-epimerase (non-hydrolyzing) [Agrococcus sp. SCSIO52902]UOV99870.1 UDP-N-acetylglucosamine 2-epimerase (non-hydrolyzing) [Agrococcus sp. SCSIO52902]